jgi:hypothetical protein
MTQVALRLPNSSGGGLPPQFIIDDDLGNQIIAIGIGEHPAQFLDGIARVTSKYLGLAEAALSAKRLEWRKERFSRLRRNLSTIRHALEALQIGDEGDFDTALIERNLSHPLLDYDTLRKLDKLGSMIRDLASVVPAVEIACDGARKEALASAKAGLDPMTVWKIWVRDMSGVWDQHGLSITVRKDELRTSPLVRLIDIVQSNLDEKYRQHTVHLPALSQAVWRALREGPNDRTNPRDVTKDSGRKNAGL